MAKVEINFHVLTFFTFPRSTNGINTAYSSELVRELITPTHALICIIASSYR